MGLQVLLAHRLAALVTLDLYVALVLILFNLSRGASLGMELHHMLHHSVALSKLLVTSFTPAVVALVPVFASSFVYAVLPLPFPSSVSLDLAVVQALFLAVVQALFTAVVQALLLFYRSSRPFESVSYNESCLSVQLINLGTVYTLGFVLSHLFCEPLVVAWALPSLLEHLNKK